MRDNGLEGIEAGESLLGAEFRHKLNNAIDAIPTEFEAARPLIITRIGHQIFLSMIQEPVFEEEVEEPEVELWGEITGSSGTAHSWDERRHTTPGGFTAVTGGKSGTLNAYDVNGRQDIPAGAIVRLHETAIAGQSTLVYEFDINHGLETSLATIGGDDEVEAEEQTTWDVEAQGATTGLTFTMLTRMAYNHAGDERLYAYYRDLIFDSNGQLLRVTVETEQTIDIPEDCPST